MIVAVVGPSGAGKDALIAGALAARPGWRAIRRAITRPAEAGGEDFEGVGEAEFARRLAAGGFLLHWEAHGLRYGLPHPGDHAGGVVLFNGSRAALPAARAALPGLRVVLVTAPEAVLAARLAARGREGAADRAARLSRAGQSLPGGADAVVDNGDTLAEGVARLVAAVEALAVAADAVQGAGG